MNNLISKRLLFSQFPKDSICFFCRAQCVGKEMTISIEKEIDYFPWVNSGRQHLLCSSPSVPCNVEVFGQGLRKECWTVFFVRNTVLQKGVPKCYRKGLTGIFDLIRINLSQVDGCTSSARSRASPQVQHFFPLDAFDWLNNLNGQYPSIQGYLADRIWSQLDQTVQLHLTGLLYGSGSHDTWVQYHCSEACLQEWSLCQPDIAAQSVVLICVHRRCLLVDCTTKRR